MNVPLVRLGEIANVNWGDTNVTKSSYVEQGYTAYSASGADGFLPYADYDRPAIILSAIGARCGKVWFAEGKWSCIKNTIRYWSTDDRLDNRYLYWISNKEGFFPKRGAAQPFITIGDAREVRVPLPALYEQRRIAAILDKADTLRFKRKGAGDLLAEALDSYVESTIKQLAGRRVQSLGGCLKFMTTGGRNWSQYYADAGSRFIRSLDVQMNSIADEEIAFVEAPDNAEARRTRTSMGDVLLTVTGSRIGRVAALPDELNGSYVSQHVAILRPKPDLLRPRFLSYFLSSRDGQRQIAKWQYGQTKPGLNFEQIERFEIPCIGVDEQAGIEDAVACFEGPAASQRLQAIQLDSLFSSLQSRAFSGHL